MTFMVVIDASALEYVLTGMPSFWELLKRKEVKVAIGKPGLIRQYSRRIDGMRRKRELKRGSLALQHLFQLAIMVNDGLCDEEKHTFQCEGEIPRKDMHLFVTAKEGALRGDVKECIILSLDSGVLDAEQCENGEDVRIVIKDPSVFNF